MGGFGIWGIAFDCISFWAFYKWGKRGLLSARTDRTYEEFDAPAEPSTPSPTSPQTSTTNMRSAFMHVGADFLRSVIIVAEGLAVESEADGQEGRKTDSVAALVVSITILLSACGAMLPW